MQSRVSYISSANGTIVFFPGHSTAREPHQASGRPCQFCEVLPTPFCLIFLFCRVPRIFQQITDLRIWMRGLSSSVFSDRLATGMSLTLSNPSPFPFRLAHSSVMQAEKISALAQQNRWTLGRNLQLLLQGPVPAWPRCGRRQLTILSDIQFRGLLILRELRAISRDRRIKRNVVFYILWFLIFLYHLLGGFCQSVDTSRLRSVNCNAGWMAASDDAGAPFFMVHVSKVDNIRYKLI